MIMWHASRAFRCLSASPTRSFGFLRRVSRAQRRDVPGQFGLPGLHEPSDWPCVAAACVTDCLKLAGQIRSHPRSRSPSVLHIFDNLSDRLCSVLDVAELCRNVHPDQDFVRAADEAFWHVSTTMQRLNADYTLYRPLKHLHQDHLHAVKNGGDVARFLSEEDLVMVESLKHDFERGGINLGLREKERLIKLQDDVSSLGAEFMSSDASSVPMLELPESKLKQIPRAIKMSLKPSVKPDHVQVNVDGSMSQILLKWISDSRIREEVFKLVHGHESQSKLAILDSLLQKRQTIAQELGRSSYAELLFGDRLASSPSDVLEFLGHLSRIVQDAGHQEKNAIEMEKLRLEPHNIKNGQPSVHGWDRSFYIGRLKAQDFDISSNEVSDYLPLSACLHGLADIVQNVFGVKMIRTNPEDGELWHEDVEKVQLVEENGRILGHIFLDLSPRKGKYGHAAHFSIRCGRQPTGNVPYQTPVVALVCNFGRASKEGSQLLSISEYETLFHEFGHSLHSLLSKTKYQHLSGTRVATDFVEVPSHLFEHFAWDPRVLCRFARHYRTGDRMPTRLVQSLCASQKGFICTDIQMQTLFSAMDLQFHGSAPPIGHTTRAFEQLQSKLTSYLPDYGVPIPSTFHHFVGYGAGYYSYIYARVISAQLWSSLFESNPLCRTGGLNLRHNLLAHGGAKDPVSMIFDVLNGEISCIPFLRSTGIDAREWQSSRTLPMSKRSSPRLAQH